MNITFQDIIDSDYILSRDSFKWLDLNKNVLMLKNKYPNILDDFVLVDGYSFPSSSYVTNVKEITNKIRLIQIGNVNEQEWIISEKRKFEFLPNTFLLSKKKYFLKNKHILVSLTGGQDITNDITSYFDSSFEAFLNQRVGAFSMKNDDDDLFFYFYALTKSPFFKKQWIGKGGIQKNTVSRERNKTYLPKINNKDVIKYISSLVQAIINKEKLIAENQKRILNEIEKELQQNQKSIIFNFDFPTISELEASTRLDTGIYSKQFKGIDFLIKNYKQGYFFLDRNNLKSGSTPDTRFIGDINILTYRWVTPTHCSDNGLIFVNEGINLKGNNNINEDCIMFINRTSKGGEGEFVGIATYYNFTDFKEGHHNQGIYRFSDKNKTKMLFILCMMNCDFMRKYCRALSVGSKMKELKMEHFLQIPFPNFPEEKQKIIVKSYHNDDVEYNFANWNLDNFLIRDNEFNKVAGIYELDKTAKQLKAKLDLAIDNIVNDKPVNIDLA